MAEHHVQYALIKKDSRNHATLGHQDDLETPLVEMTLKGLLNSMETWADRDVIEDITPEGEFTDDNDEVYVIVKELVQTVPLNADDLKKLADMSAAATADREEIEAKYH